MNREMEPADPEYRTLDLGKVVRLYWRRRYVVLACGLLGVLAAVAASFIIHPAYDATVRLMPPSPRETGLTGLLPGRNSGDLYLGLISSRTVADDVIEHQHLAAYFHTTKPSALRAMLAGMAKITEDKDQFVTVTVRAGEPETAVRVANEFPQALYRLNHEIAISEAGHRWEYFEGPLEQEKNKLAQAEEELKLAQQKTGMVMPEAQIQLGVSAIASLKQQITAREEQLAGLTTSSTAQNAQVVELRSQISSLYAQLHRLEAQTGGTGTASSAKLPELTLEVERKAREVKFHETLFEILSKQYENARVDQSYSPPVELVDRAVFPDQKSYPPRKLLTMIGLLTGLLLGAIWVGLREAQPLRHLRAFLDEDPSRLPDGPRI
jgi:uncharacterized protein involved in exopolysaccharide biosynthesis